MSMSTAIGAAISPLYTNRKVALYTVWPLLFIPLFNEILSIWGVTGNNNALNLDIYALVIFFVLVTFHWHRVALFGGNCGSIFIARNASGEYLHPKVSFQALGLYLVRSIQILLLPVLIFSGASASYLAAAIIVRHPILMMVGDLVSVVVISASTILLPLCFLSLAAIAAGSRKYTLLDAVKLGRRAPLYVLFSYFTAILAVGGVVFIFISILFMLMVLAIMFYGIAEGFSLTMSSFDHKLVMQGLAINFDLPFTNERMIVWFEGVDPMYLNAQFALKIAAILQSIAIKTFMIVGALVLVGMNAHLYKFLKQSRNYRIRDRLYYVWLSRNEVGLGDNHFTLPDALAMKAEAAMRPAE